MKNDSNKLIIHPTLSEGFMDTVKATLEDELQVASKKWNVALNEDDRQKIRTHALVQLRRKVSESSRASWDLSERVTLKVSAVKPRAGTEVFLPNASFANDPLQIIRLRDGWEVDNEARDGAVLLKDFPAAFEAKILQWARTAVFYGVGSYSQ